MGRPLNKKYFGNRNQGTGGDQIVAGTQNSVNTADDRIGGEGIASISWSTVGAFMGTSNVNAITIPALPTPTLPGGVQATWTMEFEVESVTTGAGKTDLAVGDTFAWAPSGADPIPGMVAKVTDLSGANAVFSVTVAGASRGDSMTLANIPDDTQTIVLEKVGGTGTATEFSVDIFWRVKASTVTITEKGSGYVGTETFTFTKAGSTAGTVPAGTIVLTTDTGNVGSATYQENAIVMYANVGNGASPVDVVRQISTKRYKVTDGTTTGIVELGNDATPESGEAYLIATDVNGSTYFVNKLTGHKATLTRKAMVSAYAFATDEAAPWKFDAAATGYVQIENA